MAMEHTVLPNVTQDALLTLTYCTSFSFFLCGRMFGMVLEKIIIPEVQKVSGAVEKKICAVGITKVLTECPAMMDTEYTKLW